MVTLTVNLTPPLTGVKGEMWVMFLVGGVGYWYYIIDVPTSVNGVVGPFGYADGSPFNVHQIRFPAQTIGGIAYEEAATGGFTLYENWTFNVTLNPITPPAVRDVTITTETTPVADSYVRYHGKSINQSLDTSFWSTQPEKVITTSGSSFTHTQVVGLPDGSNYVIWGNSAASGYIWHTKIFVDGLLVAEGDVDRYHQLRGNFTVSPVPVEVATTLTISAPSSVAEEETFNVSGILYETEAVIPIPYQPINFRFNGQAFGSTTTGVDGDYLLTTNIPTQGTYTLKAQFPGAPGMNASNATAEVRIGVPSNVIVPLLALGSGIALIYASKRI